jgi:uncharacterized protein YozE (UPF0346 family)
MITGKAASGFDAWLRGQINRTDHVGNLAFEASRDPAWPHEADEPDAIKKYLLEERGIYGQKIYIAVEEAWRQFDKEEVEEWRSPGGFLYELSDDLAPWVKEAMEAYGVDDPGRIGTDADGGPILLDW